MMLVLFISVFYALTLGIILITYLLYPFLSQKFFRQNKKRNPVLDFGKLYVIVSAYNEENVIDEKIKNTLKYLVSKGEIILVSDASDDGTNSICETFAKENEKVRFYINNQRGGKNTCLNLAVENIKPESKDILIFTDCNTFIDENSLPEIIKSLLSGSSLVGGSMVYKSMETNSAVSEGLYWRYEEWIRRTESKNGRLIVCNGGLLGMWADCYKSLPSYVPNDFETPLRLTGEGKNVILNPHSLGIESAINSPKEEYTRKKRMANRQMNCILYLWKGLNKGTQIQVLFHKLFRWFGLHLFVLSTIELIICNLLYNSWIFKSLMLFHLLIIGLIIISYINNYIGVEKKYLPKILHACKVHKYAAEGALNAFRGARVSVWNQAKTNR